MPGEYELDAADQDVTASSDDPCTQRGQDITPHSFLWLRCDENTMDSATWIYSDRLKFRKLDTTHDVKRLLVQDFKFYLKDHKEMPKVRLFLKGLASEHLSDLCCEDTRAVCRPRFLAGVGLRYCGR